MSNSLKGSLPWLFQIPVQLGLMLLVVILCLFVNLQAGDITLMEARNFIAAREMVSQGHWLLPTMNGQLRLAKPPLPTWITALAGLIAGNMDQLPVLRFPAAVMAALWVLFTFLLARQLTADRLIPFLAAVVLATSLAFVQAARQGTWDIYCHSFMAGAIWLLVLGCRSRQTRYTIFIGCGILLACSFLSKGPVSFYALLLPFLLAWYRGYGLHYLRLKKEALGVAVVVALLLSVSWPLYVWVSVPQALTASTAQETSAWLERHVRPFWFYWSFPVETGIWTIFAAAALVVPYARPRISGFGNYRFLASWVFLAVILLSLIPEKKERYLLPVLMPLALLTVHYLRYLIGVFAAKNYTRADLGLVAATCLLLGLASLAGPFLLYRFFYQAHAGTGLFYVAASAWTLAVGAAILFFYLKARPDLLVLAMVWLQVTVFVIGIPLYHNRDTHYSYRGLQAVRQIAAIRGLDFYAAGGMPLEQVWEVGRTVDSFYMHQQVPLLPEKLPAALFSPTPLEPAAFSPLGLQLQPIGDFHYRKDNPAAVFHLYILRPRSGLPAGNHSGNDSKSAAFGSTMPPP